MKGAPAPFSHFKTFPSSLTLTTISPTPKISKTAAQEEFLCGGLHGLS
ncbi:Hypothetical protein Cul210932_1852 [Corynebacterium ulcerans]|uniref:Uncharacterized protein n=1 Tax=Corynebacterium ulcerans FRC58 TaxID=1408268 RepID=A0ABM5U3L1_CORUL|nr:Hypothetical protein Cul210932_1852 [Corynebacterium ulcerans]AIU92397.1 Hypothetical protein Cul05146_1845 [Corynebacterium ulcerans]AKN77740.1 Hypothetical protein CulFRC58_1886 [Corynebacterium ulcerans FRC58]ALD95569.1 Hypothetical protein Cul131001_1884 [Corynebacterium ulcerans]